MYTKGDTLFPLFKSSVFVISFLIMLLLFFQFPSVFIKISHDHR